MAGFIDLFRLQVPDVERNYDGEPGEIFEEELKLGKVPDEKFKAFGDSKMDWLLEQPGDGDTPGGLQPLWPFRMEGFVGADVYIQDADKGRYHNYLSENILTYTLDYNIVKVKLTTPEESEGGGKKKIPSPGEQTVTYTIVNVDDKTDTPLAEDEYWAIVYPTDKNNASAMALAENVFGGSRPDNVQYVGSQSLMNTWHNILISNSRSDLYESAVIKIEEFEIPEEASVSSIDEYLETLGYDLSLPWWEENSEMQGYINVVGLTFDEAVVYFSVGDYSVRVAPGEPSPIIREGNNTYVVDINKDKVPVTLRPSEIHSNMLYITLSITVSSEEAESVNIDDYVPVYVVQKIKSAKVFFDEGSEDITTGVMSYPIKFYDLNGDEISFEEGDVFPNTVIPVGEDIPDWATEITINENTITSIRIWGVVGSGKVEEETWKIVYFDTRSTSDRQHVEDAFPQ